MQQNNGMNIKYYNNKKCKLTPENMFYLKEQLQIKVVFYTWNIYIPYVIFALIFWL